MGGLLSNKTSFGWSAFHSLRQLVVGLRRYDSLLLLGGGVGLLLVSGLGGGLGGFDNLLDLLLNGSGNITTHLSVLSGSTLLLADGVLGTTGLTLGLELSNTDLLSLELVDSLDQDVLVLELVTLGSEVELVVDVLVDLLGVSVLSEETTENAGSADSQDLVGHTGGGSTLSVTGTIVATSALLSLLGLDTGTGVHSNITSDDDTVLEQLTDVLAGVSKSNLVSFVGVHPDALLSALEH